MIGFLIRNTALATLCVFLACTSGSRNGGGAGGNGSGGDDVATGGSGDASGDTSMGGTNMSGMNMGGMNMGGVPVGGAGGGSGSGGAGGTRAGGSTNMGGVNMGGVPTGGTGGALNLGGAPAGRVPMFVALGEQGRTIISCDDGLHWIADQKEMTLPDSRVTPNGISFGADAFILSMGHGAPPLIRRSEDGITWTTVLDGVQRNFPFGYEDIAYGNNTFVTGGGHVSVRSTDGGKTWSAQQASMLSGDILRKMVFGDTLAGRFVAAGGTRAVYSDDLGQTWKAPAAYCTDTAGRVHYGNGTFVVAGDNGRLCVSKDGGNNWTVVTVANMTNNGPGLFTDGQLWIYNSTRVWKSTDGMTWTPTTLVPSNQNFSAVTRGASGTFVGVLNGDKFYRSPDGVTWTRVAPGNYTAGNNLTEIAFGFAKPSAMCPAP